MPSYDEDLLGSTPQVTKAQLQSGYATDLLNEKEPPTPTAAAFDPEAAVATTANRVSPVQRQETDSLTKKPFYATTKGRIIIAIAVLVIIIVAIVGGVVGSKNARAKSVKNGGSSPPASGSANSTFSGNTSETVQEQNAPSSTVEGIGSNPSPTPSSLTPSPPTPSPPTTSPPSISPLGPIIPSFSLPTSSRTS